MGYDPKSDLVALAQLKATEEALKKEKAVIEARLIAGMTSAGKDKVQADVDGETISGTVVRPERTTIDADGLSHDLTPKQWEKVSTRVLDKEKLEAAVVQKIVDITVVQRHSETTPTKPYVRVSGKVPDKALVSGVSLVNGTIHANGRRRVAKPKAGK